MKTDVYKIPSSLDEPTKIAFWTLDEFLCLFGLFFLGIIFGRFVEGIVGGFVGLHILRKLKKGESLNILRYIAYWYAPSGLFDFKRTLHSYKRELVG